MKKISILGCRGIPASHGGFETFAEHLALYLAERGWDVSVYCQEDGNGARYERQWCGIRLVTIPVGQSGPLGTIIYDWKSTVHALRERPLILTLGYNTAIFCLLYRLFGVTNIINMDGIEWQREKWRGYKRVWLYLNERFGCWLGNHLVADHPQIKAHLATRVRADKITVIPYGANAVSEAEADGSRLAPLGLTDKGYAVVIARPEPENLILEMVRAFSRRRRGVKLVVLGQFDHDNPYHQQVRAAAGDEVAFPGAIYDSATVQALRRGARLYLHGHQVGGTNPSLVEAMGAGSAILAHDNRFNRWVAGGAARYFGDEARFEEQLDELLAAPQTLAQMGEASAARHAAVFTWEQILGAYHLLFKQWSPGISVTKHGKNETASDHRIL